MGLLLEPKIFPGLANLLIVLIRQFFQHPASLGRVRSSPVLRPSSHSQQVYGMRAQHNASMEATKPDLTRRVMGGIPFNTKTALLYLIVCNDGDGTTHT